MYNLSPRLPNRPTRTPPNVGPNSYIICGKDYNLKNRVPFLSEAKRTCGKTGPLYTHAIYDIEGYGRRIQGGASVKYTDIRSRHKCSNSPGPADYHPKILKRGCKPITPPCHGTGRLYVCRVPYTVTVSAPSIPTHINENGYDVDVNQDLIRVPPNEHDRTRGPAYYNVPRGELFFTSRRYRGCNWSISKTQRSAKPKFRTPGPGEYDVANINVCKCSQEDEEYRGLARLLTFLPRYTEGKMLKAEKEDLPGPGYYDVDKCCHRCKESLSIYPRPFVVGAERFKSLQSGNPGPGEYEASYCDKEQRQFSTKDAPFGFDALRFPDKKKFETPSPATYHIKGPLDEKLASKFYKYSVVDAPFLKTSERTMGPQPNGVPGPGTYDSEEQPKEELPIDASVFKSRTSRFKIKCEDDYAPSYNISDAFNKNCNRTSTNAGKVPFLSLKKRESKFEKDTPAPDEYLSHGKMGLKGLSFSTTPRFKCSGNDIPPPGHYTVHPAYDQSIYKAIGTHNLRLKENVLRKKLRVPPGVTWEAWAATLKKKKKLKWFEEPKIG